MKQINEKGPLLNILSEVLKNRKTIYSVEDWSALPLILKTLNKRCFVECEEDCFDDVSSSFDFLSNAIVFVPFVEKGGKSFSKTYHEEMFDRASVLMSSNHKKTKTFIVHKKAVDSPLFYNKKKDSFSVSGGAEPKEGLIDFLNTNNYSRVEAPEFPGEYSIRGGVVDVFSFGLTHPFRVGFLGGDGGVLYFDINTGDVMRESKTAKVYAFPKKPLFSIKSRAQNVELWLRCFKNNLEISNKKNSLTSTFKSKVSFKSINYRSYKKNNGKNIFFSSSLLSRGFEFDGSFYLPRWFSRASQNKKTNKKIPLVGSLNAGDYYVHETYGVCQYAGTVPGSEDDKKGFVSLKFLDGKINLSAQLLGQIYFYAPSGAECSLGSLSKNKGWQRKKGKAEKHASLFIKEVLSSYAKRESSLVFPYEKNQSLLDLFLSEFSFLDTSDQAVAWKEIMEDLCCDRPMYRLLCGDVGFGKTEIAMRAVFLSFINNRQSIVLAPTTLLSEQLFMCFQERLASFGCRVGQVSRLTKENNKKFSAFLNKEIDLLVGTHSIIKKPDVLSRASLLVVDEEHRFGVKDKEKILAFSPGCNYLSMSATPIPRTLQLALSGIRNISTLLSPPVERKPIITNIHAFNTETIKNYFLKEINRGGQVYFVDNSVNSLKQKLVFFQKELPDISFALLYGGMKKEQIKSTMVSFRKKEITVLFSTTLIESGIDVSSANTVVINNAHMFGLSQLHQIRGRVGRHNKQSFACLLVPKNKKITPDGKSRLSSIKKHSSLGSGYSLSLEDLQIRGSGSLFGYKQSGDSVVGFDYYSKILSKTIRLGAFSPGSPDPVVDFDSAYISPSLIEDDAQRIFYYKKISDCLNEDSLNSFFNETSSLFGPLPPPMLLLFKCKSLALLAEKTPIVGIKKIKDSFILTASSLLLKNIPTFLSLVSSFFDSRGLLYAVSSDSNFLKIKFSYVKEDSYILLEKFLIKAHVK